MTIIRSGSIVQFTIVEQKINIIDRGIRIATFNKTQFCLYLLNSLYFSGNTYILDEDEPFQCFSRWI